MRFPAAVLAAVLVLGGAAHGQVAAPAAPAGTVQQPAPAPVPAPGGAAVVPAPVVPPLPLGARTFTGKSGLIFNAVRPDRVVDFEMVIAYLQAALEKSTDARVQEQAKGWRVFKATEPGPNGSVLYVFVIDPAVAGADYGLGRILAEAYPDQIEKIWSLYTGSQASGGSLLNLTPVQPGAPLPVPPSSAPPSAPASLPGAAPRPTTPAVP
jgi:hypothetical protein